MSRLGCIFSCCRLFACTWMLMRIRPQLFWRGRVGYQRKRDLSKQAGHPCFHKLLSGQVMSRSASFSWAKSCFSIMPQPNNLQKGHMPSAERMAGRGLETRWRFGGRSGPGEWWVQPLSPETRTEDNSIKPTRWIIVPGDASAPKPRINRQVPIFLPSYLPSFLNLFRAFFVALPPIVLVLALLLFSWCIWFFWCLRRSYCCKVPHRPNDRCQGARNSPQNHIPICS